MAANMKKQRPIRCAKGRSLKKSRFVFTSDLGLWFLIKNSRTMNTRFLLLMVAILALGGVGIVLTASLNAGDQEDQAEPITLFGEE